MSLLDRRRVRHVASVPVFVLMAGAAAVVAIVALQNRSDGSRRAQADLAQVSADLGQLQAAPFGIVVGAKPAAVRRQMTQLELRARASVDRLRQGNAVPALAHVDAQLDRAAAAEAKELGLLELFLTAHGRTEMAAAFLAPAGSPVEAVVTAPLEQAQQASQAVARTLTVAGGQYDARASRAKRQSLAGSVLAIAVLVAAFAYAYGRARRAHAETERLAAENASLAELNRHEAITDALTGLRNRRGLVAALEAALAGGDPAEGRIALALFDLDGFKQYNDRFGHPAGDAMLTLLGGRLARSVDGVGAAFRMGGDEFCVLAPAAQGDAETLTRRAAAALCAAGDGYAITCSYGLAVVPDDARSAEEALRLADQRMYAEKAGKLRVA